MGDKHYEASGTSHFSKVFRGPAVRGVSGYPLQSERQIAASYSLYHKEGGRALCRPLLLLESTHSTTRKSSGLGTKWHGRLPPLNRTQNRKGLCDNSRLQCKQPWLTVGPYDPADPSGVSDGKRCGVEFMASLVEESWHRPLGFWSTVMPSAADNCMPIEKQLLVYHCALKRLNTWPRDTNLSIPPVPIQLSDRFSNSIIPSIFICWHSDKRKCFPSPSLIYL